MTPQALADLHALAFSATRAWSAQEFESLLNHPGAILASNDASFALLRVVADEAEVLTLATDPAKRRQGLARATLVSGEALAMDRGAKTVFLEVAEDNAAARTLYETSGYAQVGRRPGYYIPQGGTPVAALVLRKELKPS
ncbi:GNAT family N-acetyltransferase [Loktanella sp. Alg231-35]|uniref:GNAT family N-acetyltransferase n=1 Tax=Loktanella sp. Alg231-35 TaxID=1922220 RepID=UPI000D553994|nr:GNAT family N-acetyltransferase [Loktanella sp. Alg231-35]